MQPDRNMCSNVFYIQFRFWLWQAVRWLCPYRLIVIMVLAIMRYLSMRLFSSKLYSGQKWRLAHRCRHGIHEFYVQILSRWNPKCILRQFYSATEIPFQKVEKSSRKSHLLPWSCGQIFQFIIGNLIHLFGLPRVQQPKKVTIALICGTDEQLVQKNNCFFSA